MLQGDLITEVRKRKQARDIVITGSASVVHTLMAHGEVDECRLIVFPLVLGEARACSPTARPPSAWSWYRPRQSVPLSA